MYINLSVFSIMGVLRHDMFYYCCAHDIMICMHIFFFEEYAYDYDMTISHKFSKSNILLQTQYTHTHKFIEKGYMYIRK